MKDITPYFQNILRAIFYPKAIGASDVVIFKLDDTGSPQSPQCDFEEITMAEFIAMYWAVVGDYSDPKLTERIKCRQTDDASLQKIVDFFTGRTYTEDLGVPVSNYLDAVITRKIKEGTCSESLYNLPYLDCGALVEVLGRFPRESQIRFMSAFRVYDPDAPQNPPTTDAGAATKNDAATANTIETSGDTYENGHSGVVGTIPLIP